MRKTLLISTAVGVATFGLVSIGAVETASAQQVKGPKLTWKLSLWGKGRAFSEGLEFISKEVKAPTGGNFDIKLVYGEQLSKRKEDLDGISVGACETALFRAAYHPGKSPAQEPFDLVQATAKEASMKY